MTQPDTRTALHLLDGPGQPAADDARGARGEGVGVYSGIVCDTSDGNLDHVVAGQRVGLVGLDNAVLRSLPAIAKSAELVRFFQLTPRWILPQSYRRAVVVADRMGHLVPDTVRGGMTGATAWAGRRHLSRAGGTPWFRWQLAPKPGAPARAPLFSDTFYQTMLLPNCSLVGWPIARFSPIGLRTSDGLEHRLDVIIMSAEGWQKWGQGAREVKT